MDFVGGRGEDNEEDKYVVMSNLIINSTHLTFCYRYSGVQRQDFPPLSGSRENRYMPPAKRAPSSQATVKGAPVDPAIISSQIKAPPKKQSSPGTDQTKAQQPPNSGKNGSSTKAEVKRVVEAQVTEDVKPKEAKVSATPRDSKSPEDKTSDKSAPSRATPTPTPRNAVPQVQEVTPSATSTVERDVLKEFKTFASQQRMNAEKVRTSKAKADKEVKLTELKKFANSFKLSTPVPTDLVSIIAKDPAKQKEIQAKAIKNAEEVARAKVDVVTKPDKEKANTTKEVQSKPVEQSPAAPSTETRPSRTPAGPQATPPNNGANRHLGPRQQFPQQAYHSQPYRNNRGGPQHAPPQHPTGTLAQRLRNVEQQKYSQPPAHQHQPGPEIRAPPTGPANNLDRRHSSHITGKLNPNSHEFRPSPFAASFNPNGHPSTSSSPRSAVNPVPEATATGSNVGQLIRRKTKAVDVNKCLILSHIKTISPPKGRNWDDNGGLRPSFDTLPTWRQLQDDEKSDSTMHLTYKEYFDRQPFSGPSMPTPNPPHVVPQMAHQHQLPFHLQHGAHSMGPRQSPHMPPMQMHTPQHGHAPHQPYGGDDHRMMHSNSAQSFASPRMGHLAVAYPGVSSPAQVQYNQPVFVGPGNPQMGQFRSFSNNPHYAPHQQGQMGSPMMMQPQFIPGPQGIMAAPHMMYPSGHHPQFIAPSGPPQQVPSANGYPSPGRPAAPLMVHQGSQQGQHMYSMSPNVQYNQPAYAPGQANGSSQ